MNISYTIARYNLGDMTEAGEESYSAAVCARLCVMYPGADVSTCVDDVGDRDRVIIEGPELAGDADIEIAIACREAAQAVYESADWGTA